MSGKKHGDKRKIEALSEDEKTTVKKEGSVTIIDDKTKMKRSSRNASEKRRRDKLNTYINELSAMVPSCSSPHSSRKLDKSTILKLTVSYMKLHADLLSPSPNESTVSWKPAFLSNEELATLMLEALDGFLFVLSVTGRILYVSHTVAPLLGHLQNSLIGRSLFDLVHETDSAILDHSLKTHFNSEMSESSSSTGNKAKVSFSIRMLRGGMNSYELVHCSGNVRRWEDAIKNPNQDGISEIASLSQGMLETEDNPTHVLVAVGKMEAPKLIRDISSLDLGKNEYLSRHNLEAKYLYVDNKAASIIGYLPSEVIGCSAYDFYHLDDLSILSVNHKNLMNHGNSATMFYRFLTKGQQWIWMQTHGYVEANKWTNKPETIICHNVVVSYSKVLEYLHARAMEYGPALPPITPGNSRTPHEVLITSLTGTRNKALNISDHHESRISDVTPGIHKEEPPSPPNMSAASGQSGHFTNVPPMPDNLFPRSSNANQTVYHIIENVPDNANQDNQVFGKMEISPSPVQETDHSVMQQQQQPEQPPQQPLQHISALRGPVINIPKQPHQTIQHVPQQMAQQQQQQSHHVIQGDQIAQQPRLSPGAHQLSAMQQQHSASTSEHSPAANSVQMPVTTNGNIHHNHVHLPTTNGHIGHQQIALKHSLLHQASNGLKNAQRTQQQQIRPQNSHVLQGNIQQPSCMPQQGGMSQQQSNISQQQSSMSQQQSNIHQQQSGISMQHTEISQQQQQGGIQQQQQTNVQGSLIHQSIPQRQNIVQQQHQATRAPIQSHEAPLLFSQSSNSLDKHVNSPVGHQLSNSNPATPIHIPAPQPTQQQQAPQQRHPTPQILLLPSGQHGYITNQSQLRPTINVQGMQYINVNNNNGPDTTPNVVSPATPVTPHPTTQQEFTSPNVKPSNLAQYATSQLAATQQYSIVPTSGGGIQVPNSNVIMIQPVPSGGGGPPQYQLAQLYPLIQAVNTNNGNLAAIPQKLTPQNGETHNDLSKNPNTICHPIPTVKREQARCVKSPNTQINVSQCGGPEKTIFRSTSDEFNLSSANSDHNVLDHFDPEVISMILNNTNIDNFNLDNQWNHNLFDNPPNSTHSTSSNPSPISAHSPGT